MTGDLDRGSQFMKKNPVGRAVGNVLKPVGSGRGTARPAPGAKPGTAGGGATTRPMMNSHEPEGEMTEDSRTINWSCWRRSCSIQSIQGNADCQQNEE